MMIVWEITSPIIGEFGVKVSVSQRRQSALEIQKIPNKDIWIHLTEEGILACAKEVVGVIHKYEGEK